MTFIFYIKYDLYNRNNFKRFYFFQMFCCDAIIYKKYYICDIINEKFNDFIYLICYFELRKINIILKKT